LLLLTYVIVRATPEVMVRAANLLRSRSRAAERRQLDTGWFALT
jgi:hypothetical protein